MAGKNIAATVEELLTPTVEGLGYDVWDVEYVKIGADYHLIITIDKAEGITIEDCELISRALSDMLDEKDFIPDAYILEVSSPGLGRQLKKDKDFKRSLGEEVEIKLYKPMDKKKELIGLLENFDTENLYLTLEDGEEPLCIPRKNIAMVRLTFDF